MEKTTKLLAELSDKMSRAKSSCLFFHSWSVWEDYEQGRVRYDAFNNPTHQFTQTWQKRNCLDCGKKQERKP